MGLKVFGFEHLRGRHSSALLEQYQLFNFFEDSSIRAIQQPLGSDNSQQ